MCSLDRKKESNMTQAEIISFVKENNNYYSFETPIVVRMSPHDKGIRITALQVVADDLRIYHTEGMTVWEYTNYQVQNSIIQRVKLLKVRL